MASRVRRGGGPGRGSRLVGGATRRYRPSARRLALVIVIALLLAGCGGQAQSRARLGAVGRERPPTGWPVMRIPAGAALSYPPGWRLVRGDAGTATAGLVTDANRYRGYLNLTPQQGAETLANWPVFRVQHNREEGESQVVQLQADTGLRFRAGRGACVRDSYTTSVGTRYTEIACLVAGRRATVVVIGASPLPDWRRISPLMERAIASVAL